MIGLTYKNYSNSALTSSATAFAINISIDNFVVRPVLSFLIAIPLSQSQTIQAFVLRSQQQELWIEEYERTGGKAFLDKPGKHFSPSKLPQRIPCNMEVEPNLPLPEERPSEQKLARSMDFLKQLRKEQTLPPLFTTARDK